MKNIDKTDLILWQKGLSMFAQCTAWIAGPVVAALYLGKWLDTRYNSAPLYFLALTIGAFIISSVGIGLTGIKYLKQIELLTKQSKKKETDNGESDRS